MSGTKNVIILKDVKSNVFEEVIFILKKGSERPSAENPNLIYEARRIVEEYATDKRVYTLPSISAVGEDKRGLNTILNISLALSIVIFTFMLARIF